MDPQANANYAAGMIAGLLKSNGGDVHAALSAYNAGSPTATGTKTTWGDGTTLGYADSVMRHYSQLTGTAAPAVVATAPAAAGTTTDPGQAVADKYVNQMMVASLQTMMMTQSSANAASFMAAKNVAPAEAAPSSATSSAALISNTVADDA